jgi:4-amino-4-deoxy-L-arabinose transferase-like glycosyltransferase
VATSNISIYASPKPAAAVRLAWTLLILATLYLCYFSHLGAIGFVGPDEPRYAWIARDMAESGDWVTPRLYGQPWFEKPGLYYWGAALSFKIFGVSEASARLPSALSALFATLALAWLALRLSGVSTARWLLLLLPTTVGMIGFSHAAATDMPFSGMLTIAMVFAAVVIGIVPATQSAATQTVPTRSPFSVTSITSFPSFFFGFFLGLAVLAKGPAAIILSGGAVFFWALFTKRWRDAFRLFHPAALLAFFLTALPWYILCAHRNPDFFRIFIIEHNFKRYLTPEFQHIQPFWYYLPIILIAIFPWTVFLLGVVADAFHSLREGRWTKSSSLFLVLWALFPLIFFSVSKSKLPGYVLPALPPLVILVARNLATGFQQRLASARWFTMALAMLVMVPAGGMWYIAHIVPANIPRFLHPPLLWAPLLGLVGLSALILALWNRPQIGFLIAFVSVLCSVEAIQLSLKKPDLQAFSIRAGVQAAMNHWADFDPARTFSFNQSRGEQYSLNFYMRREVPVWSPECQRPGWVFGRRKLGGDSWTENMDCIFVTESDSLYQPVVCMEPGTH